jgi:hypothetical protein
VNVVTEKGIFRRHTNLMKSPESKLNSVEFPENCHVSRRLKGVGLKVSDRLTADELDSAVA